MRLQQAAHNADMDTVEKLHRYGVSCLVKNNAGRLPAAVSKAAVSLPTPSLALLPAPLPKRTWHYVPGYVPCETGRRLVSCRRTRTMLGPCWDKLPLGQVASNNCLLPHEQRWLCAATYPHTEEDACVWSKCAVMRLSRDKDRHSGIATRNCLACRYCNRRRAVTTVARG